MTDLNDVAARHAKTARLSVVAEGKRAKQLAKRASWETLTTNLDDKVTHFVTAILNRESFEVALTELQLDHTDD